MNAGTDLIILLLCSGEFAFTENLRCKQDGVKDLDISGAPADVAADGKRRFVAGWIRILIYESFGTHYHARNTEAALYCARFSESIGIDIPFPAGKAFDGYDVFAFKLVRLQDTGLGCLAVNQQGTGTAGTFTAPVLDTGQVHRITQIAYQFLIFLYCNGFAVYCKLSHKAPLFANPSEGSLVLIQIIFIISYREENAIEKPCHRDTFQRTTKRAAPFGAAPMYLIFLLFQRERIFAVRFFNGNGIADRRGISCDVFHAYLRVDFDLKFRRMVFFFDRVLYHHNGDGAALSSCIDHVILPPFSPEWS